MSNELLKVIMKVIVTLREERVKVILKEVKGRKRDEVQLIENLASKLCQQNRFDALRLRTDSPEQPTSDFRVRLMNLKTLSTPCSAKMSMESKMTVIFLPDFFCFAIVSHVILTSSVNPSCESKSIVPGSNFVVDVEAKGGIETQSIKFSLFEL